VQKVVTFGEAMIRLTPPGLQRVEQANALDVWVAGAELNVAVGLARLGRPASWVSCLPSNALGRKVAAHARANDVATSGVHWVSDGRLGLFFTEIGHTPRPSVTLYDRERSAFASLHASVFDWQTLLADACAFHTSGITPALSPACAEAARQALAAARGAGCHTSYDLNYRSMLSAPGTARQVLHLLAPLIDTLIASSLEAEAVFGLTGDPRDVAQALRDQLSIERVVVSARVDARNGGQTRHSACVDGSHSEVVSPAFHTVDPLGGGDAFSAGFLHGLLEDGPHRGLEIGGALAALKQSIPGDSAVVSRDEVDHLLNGHAAFTRR
jgi:2-dehydro-3-deoxygluconokinase